MDNARRTVVQALMKQENNGYANLILLQVLDKAKLDSRDAAFTSAVFYGTLERLLTLDFILQQFLTKPLAKLDAPVRAILRSGLYQVRYMENVPNAAAINEAVTLTKTMKKASAAGMVNAVLRRAASFDIEAASFTDATHKNSILYSVSPQVIHCIEKSYPAQTEHILQSLFTAPPLYVRVNTLKTTPEKLTQLLAQQEITAHPGMVPNSLVLTSKGNITQLPAFQQGLFHVQGEASQLACAALCPTAGSTVLDLCAAPGGKSVTLAQYMHNEGKLFCCDAAENRLALIESALQRCGITCAAVQQNDASIENAALPQADFVLCDVPCSGLGIMAKKPDIRYKTMEGLAQLTALQAKILNTAARYVKKGGTLVYSTCTMNKDENIAVTRTFAQQHKDFVPVEIKNIPQNAVIEEKTVTLLPDFNGSDGFYIAKFERL